MILHRNLVHQNFPPIMAENDRSKQYRSEVAKDGGRTKHQKHQGATASHGTVNLVCKRTSIYIVLLETISRHVGIFPTRPGESNLKKSKHHKGPGVDAEFSVCTCTL